MQLLCVLFTCGIATAIPFVTFTQAMSPGLSSVWPGGECDLKGAFLSSRGMPYESLPQNRLYISAQYTVFLCLVHCSSKAHCRYCGRSLYVMVVSVESIPLVCLVHAGDLDFVRVQDGLFVDSSCREITFSGYNSWKVRASESPPYKEPSQTRCPALNTSLIRRICPSRFFLTALLLPQTIEAALDMCCGGRQAVIQEFQQAGKGLCQRLLASQQCISLWQLEEHG